jgi:hypothetical protein
MKRMGDDGGDEEVFYLTMKSAGTLTIICQKMVSDHARQTGRSQDTEIHRPALCVCRFGRGLSAIRNWITLNL